MFAASILWRLLRHIPDCRRYRCPWVPTRQQFSQRRIDPAPLDVSLPVILAPTQTDRPKRMVLEDPQTRHVGVGETALNPLPRPT